MNDEKPIDTMEPRAIDAEIAEFLGGTWWTLYQCVTGDDINDTSGEYYLSVNGDRPFSMSGQFEWLQTRDGVPSSDCFFQVPHYSTDLADAFALGEGLAKRGLQRQYSIAVCDLGTRGCRNDHEEYRALIQADALTRARAALRVLREAKEE